MFISKKNIFNKYQKIIIFSICLIPNSLFFYFLVRIFTSLLYFMINPSPSKVKLSKFRRNKYIYLKKRERSKNAQLDISLFISHVDPFDRINLLLTVFETNSKDVIAAHKRTRSNSSRFAHPTTLGLMLFVVDISSY